MKTSPETQEFLQKLQAEAVFQKKLHDYRLLPKKVDSITSFIGTHSWQVILVLSVLTAVVLEVIEKA